VLCNARAGIPASAVNLAAFGSDGADGPGASNALARGSRVIEASRAVRNLVRNTNPSLTGSKSPEHRGIFGYCARGIRIIWRRPRYAFSYKRPAARAQRYFAPSTATGFSVVYAYAGIPWSNR